MRGERKLSLTLCRCSIQARTTRYPNAKFYEETKVCGPLRIAPQTKSDDSPTLEKRTRVGSLGNRASMKLGNYLNEWTYTSTPSCTWNRTKNAPVLPSPCPWGTRQSDGNGAGRSVALGRVTTTCCATALPCFIITGSLYHIVSYRCITYIVVVSHRCCITSLYHIVVSHRRCITSLYHIVV